MDNGQLSEAIMPNREEVKPSNKTFLLVVFTLDEYGFALSLTAVDRVIPAIAVRPLSDAPAFVLGVINLQGHIMPVIDLRKRFNLPGRELLITDQLIIARTSKQSIALVVDEVIDVVERSERDVFKPDEIFPGIGDIEGVFKLGDEMIFIHDLNKCLTVEEETSLNESTAKQEG